MTDNFIFTKLDTFDEFVTEKVNVIKNDLLGDYNENGKYIINKKVIVELLELEKVKRSSFNNSIFCTSYLPGFGEITFELTLKRQGNNGIASIYVLENVDKVNGYIQNTLRTQVAIYKDVLTPDFIEKSYKGFHIKKNEEQDQKELNPEDLKTSLNSYIGARKYFIDLMDHATNDDYNTMYQQYFNKRIDLLNENASEYSSLVLNSYRTEYNKIKDYFLKNEGAVDYKALNELLDKCFEDINGLNPSYKEKEEEFKKKMIPYLHILMTQAQIIMQKGKNKVVDKAKSADKEKLVEVAKDKEQVEKSKDDKSSGDSVKQKDLSKAPQKESKETSIGTGGIFDYRDQTITPINEIALQNMKAQEQSKVREVLPEANKTDSDPVITSVHPGNDLSDSPFQGLD